MITTSKLPWEPRPDGSADLVWRSARNPIITRDAVPAANSIFNSAVAPFADGFAGVFRVDDEVRRFRLHRGTSPDGYVWEIDPRPIEFEPVAAGIPAYRGGYDPRVIPWADGRYYLNWCDASQGFSVGLGYTDDFARFVELEPATLPWNRNGVLFPRKIRGRYALLSRPSDTSHTPFGDIYYSESPDLEFWGHHRLVMKPASAWESTKIGSGPPPIETDEGWLLLYHGVNTSCNGMLYAMGAALLDPDEPWRVIARADRYLLAPRELYERVGDVPNVVFPTAALADESGKRLCIYYGGADTVVGLAFAYVDELVAFVRENAV